jgi:NADH dehydrogenase
MKSSFPPQRIVIAGGGFAGVAAALELERQLAGHEQVQITLVNRENFSLFTPMLHEVAASDLEITAIVNPLRKLVRRCEFFAGNIEAIDLHRRTIRVNHGVNRQGDEAHGHDLPYDHLVLALGATSNFYGTPGVAERALTMKSLGDAIFLRNRIVEQLEAADVECFAAEREPLLTFVVAGGGFAGVETAAALNDFLHEATRYYRKLRREMVRVVLVHAGEVILPELSDSLGRYAARKLQARGVEIRLGTKVTSISGDRVGLSDGTTLLARTLVWTAGTASHPLVAGLPCGSRQGRVAVTNELEVPEWPGVWALGDCAWVPKAQTGGAYAPTAQNAVRQGRVVGRNIAATMRGGERQEFVYNAVGQLAAIGRRTGVAQVFGLTFSGFFAWWMWRTIYLAKLPRLEKKVRVALDWTLDLLFSKDLVQFVTSRTNADDGRTNTEIPGYSPSQRREQHSP